MKRILLIILLVIVSSCSIIKYKSINQDTIQIPEVQFTNRYFQDEIKQNTWTQIDSAVCSKSKMPY